MSNVSPALVKFAEPSEGHFWGIPHLPKERIRRMFKLPNVKVINQILLLTAEQVKHHKS